MTAVFGIVGDPIAQARSPDVFNALFRERGVDAVMVPMHVVPGDFAAALAGIARIRNLGGLVITVPHKFAAAQLLAVPSYKVAIAGAANAIRLTDEGWAGDLFDGEGFARGVEARHGALAGRRCAIVGSGGAGTAIAIALAERGVREIRLWDIDPGRAVLLQQRLQSFTAVPVTIARPSKDDDIAINASYAGMAPADDLPFSPRDLQPGALICETIMKPPKTRLLVEAERLGHPIQEGCHMLDFQVGAIWEFFGLKT
jgi:shikimate dehydrogenase